MSAPASSHVDTRPYLLERVDEAAVVQLYADGFTALPLREKILIYHLYEAALAGRDIYYDQRYAHNLAMRGVLEGIITHADGIVRGHARGDPALHEAVLDQHRPLQQPDGAEVRPEVRARGVLRGRPTRRANGARMPVDPASLRPYLFDLDVDPIVTSKTPGAGKDILESSANNLYSGVTMADVEGFDRAVSAELAPREGGRSSRRGGLPARRALRRVHPRDRPSPRGRNPLRDRLDGGRAAGAHPASTRPAKTRTAPPTTSPGSRIATPRSTPSTASSRSTWTRAAMKGAWEALVYYVNPEKTAGIRKLAAAAQWFEDRMPWADEYKKQGVRGVSANAIDVVIETGDSGPVTPDRHQPAERSDDPRACTAASRCRSRTPTRPTTSRRCRSSAASSPGAPRKPNGPRSGAASPAS